MNNKDILSLIFRRLDVFALLRYRTMNKLWNKCIVNDPRWTHKIKEIKKHIERFLIGTFHVKAWEQYPPFHSYVHYSLKNIIRSDDKIISTLIKNQTLFAVLCQISDIDSTTHDTRKRKREPPDARCTRWENNQTFWIPRETNSIQRFNNGNVQENYKPKGFMSKYIKIIS